MTLFVRLGVFIAMGWALFAPPQVGAAERVGPAGKEAYIERIPPAEFLDVELLGPQRFTAISELVILRTNRERITYALTLQRKAEGGLEWVAYFIPKDLNAPVPSLSCDFDAKVARQYSGALNYRMSRWVTVVERSHDPKSYDDAWWFYYPVANGAIAGLLDGPSLERIPQAKMFKALFLDAPEALIRAEPADRNAILARIDVGASDIIRQESSK